MKTIDKIFDYFPDKIGNTTNFLNKTTDIKEWKLKIRKIFVLFLPVSFPLWISLIICLAVVLAILGSLFISLLIGTVIIMSIISIPAWIYELYTDKQSAVLNFWR